jgi:uncharacterized protein (DUF2164 family)
MTFITFPPPVKDDVVGKLRSYLSSELDVDLGRFDAEFLVDFITTHLGAYYYNRGLTDALAVMMQRVDEIKEHVYALEQPTDIADSGR